MNEWIQHPVQAEWTPHYTLCSFCAVTVVVSRADGYCQFRLVAGNPVRRRPLDEFGRVLFGLYPPGFPVRSRCCCRSLHPLTSTGWWLCGRCSLAHWPILCNVFSASIGGFSDGGGDVGNTHLSPSPPICLTWSWLSLSLLVVSPMVVSTLPCITGYWSSQHGLLMVSAMVSPPPLSPTLTRYW